MGQRNLPCTTQMIDLEMDQRDRGYMLPEPCVILGGVTSFPQTMQTIVGASGNTSILDTHRHHDDAVFYGMPAYHGVHHRHSTNVNTGVPPASNLYIPYMPTPSSGMPASHGSLDQLPSSSNFGVCAEDYGRNNHFMDNVGGSDKRKMTEGFSGSFQYLNAPATLSSTVAPLRTRHPDGITPIDAASFSLPQYRRNDTPSIREVECQRSVRNRLVATSGMNPVLAHSDNHFFQGNFVCQPFEPTDWLEQQLDGGASTWTRAPMMPYMHGITVNGAPTESGNMVAQRYPETTTNRSSAFPHPSFIVRHHSSHHPSPPVHGVRIHNTNVHPQVAASSYRAPSSYSTQSTMNLSQDGLEMVPRHRGHVPPTGFRIYHSPPEGPVPEATLRQRNLPQLRVLPSDEVALLEIPDFYEVGNLIDHHRDLRLDIEDMSYEELLALGERIGNVNTGLTENAVISQLKTRIYLSAATNKYLKERASVDQEPDSCIICQENYRYCEKIGTLDCGHEFHAECLKKWLLMKNICPVCKSEALATKC